MTKCVLSSDRGAYKAVEGKRKVYIIAEAEKMTAPAANCLLKTLEEPPGEMVLILLTSAYNALLPTIRSRCQSLKFSLTPPTLLRRELMERLGLTASEAKWLALRSQGRIGRALRLAEEKKEDVDDEMSASFLDISRNSKPSLLQNIQESRKPG